MPVLTISPINVTPLEGQPITLKCSTSEDQVVVKWLFNGTKIELDDERYKFSPPGLNNNLTIINPSTSESGNYSCEIDVDSVIEMRPVTVNITVFAGTHIMYMHFIKLSLIKIQCSYSYIRIIFITHSCIYFYSSASVVFKNSQNVLLAYLWLITKFILCMYICICNTCSLSV